MKRALITGGAGFIGSHLAGRLLASGLEVVVVDDLYTGSEQNINEYRGDSKFRFVKGDVGELKPDSFLEQHGAFDEIYNLACPASPIHYQYAPLKTIRTSLNGAFFVTELARATGAKMLHASTSEIYGDPLVHPQNERYWGNVNTIGKRSCYDEGKRAAETIISDSAREYGIDARMARIFNTYGPKMHPQDGRVVSNFIMAALRGEKITVYGDGSQTRSFQYVSDLLDAFELYMAKPKDLLDKFFAGHNLEANVLNIGNEGEFTIRQLAESVLALVPQSPSQIEYRPLPSDDPKRRRPDTTLAKELLGWHAKVKLEEGLKRTVEYFKGL